MAILINVNKTGCDDYKKKLTTLFFPWRTNEFWQALTDSQKDGIIAIKN